MSTQTVDAGTGGHRLRLSDLAEGCWRLCDTSIPSDHAAHVVAYVERSGSGFDVVWLQGPPGHAWVPTMDDALAAAAAILRENDTHGPTRPVSIPHFAPPPLAAR